MEEFKAAFLFVGEFRLALECSIELGAAGDEGEEELFQRTSDAVGIDVGRAESAGEQDAVTRDGVELPPHVGQRFVHLGGILNGKQDLLAET